MPAARDDLHQAIQTSGSTRPTELSQCHCGELRNCINLSNLANDDEDDRTLLFEFQREPRGRCSEN